MALTPVQQIAVVVLVSSGLSFLGSAFILISHTLLKRGTFSDKLVVLLSITDLLNTMASIYSQAPFLVSSEYEEWFCQSSAFAVLMTQQSALVWTLLFSTSVWLLLARDVKVSSLKRLVPLFICLAWLLPFGATLGLYLEGRLGFAGVGCWLVVGDSLRLYAYYLPLIIVFVITLAQYVSIVWSTYSRQKLLNSTSSKKAVRSVSYRVTTYLLVFVLCWGLTTVLTIIQVFDTTIELPLWLVCVQFFTFPLYGFGNAMVYGSKMRKHWCKPRAGSGSRPTTKSSRRHSTQNPLHELSIETTRLASSTGTMASVEV